MPRPKKPANQRQRTNTAGAGELAEAPDPAAVPAMPPGRHLKATKEWWQRLWTSPVATLIDPASDLPALTRLVQLYDEHGTLRNHVARGKRLTVGSTGQMVLDPLYKHMTTIAGEITALEDRFGLSPMARLKLGAELGAAKRGLDAMNAEVAAGGGGADDDEDEDPRRLYAIDTTAEES
jgi:P27 family predicted phage terminase small subunit